MNLLQIIEENTTEFSGIGMVQLAVKAGIGIASLKPLLKELHTAGKITVREGINHKLIFLKNGKDKT